MCVCVGARRPASPLDWRTFKVSTTKIFLVVLSNVPERYVINIPDREFQITFAKSGYLTGGDIPTIRKIDLENRFIGRTFTYERGVLIILATDIFGSFRDQRNKSVLDIHGVVKGGGLLWRTYFFCFN